MGTRRTNSRRARRAPYRISPQAIRDELPGLVPRPAGAQPAPILVTDEAEPAILLGRARLAQHRAHTPEELIDALVLPLRDRHAIRVVGQLDAQAPPPPSVRARAIRALLDHGLGLAQLVDLVPGIGSKAAASRWAAIGGLHGYVLEMLDRGRLSFSHVAMLLPLPADVQRMWAERCVAHRWSFARLRQALAENRKREQSTGDTDVSAYAAALQGALGSPVELTWNAAASRGGLALSWFTVEELQGLMERLGAAPPALDPLPSRRRRIHIEVDSVAELDQLTSHLVNERD